MQSEAALGDLSDFHEEFTLKRLFVTQDSVFSSLFGYFVRWKLFGLSLDCLVCWPSYCALVEQCHALVRVRWNNWYLSINNHNSSIVLLVFYLLQLVSSIDSDTNRILRIVAAERSTVLHMDFSILWIEVSRLPSALRSKFDYQNEPLPCRLISKIPNHPFE